MTELRQLDEVAYVRFASVYRSFQDLEEFKREIDSMGQVKRPKRKRVVVQNDRDQVFLAEALKLAKRGLHDASQSSRRVPARQGRCRDWSWLSCKGWRSPRGNRPERSGANAKGATAYVTLEPCSFHGRTPACANALIEQGQARGCRDD